MSIFDTIKNAFGKSEPDQDETTAPTQLLREAGIDPEGLTFGFGDRSVTVSGTIARESDRQQILDLLSALPGIRDVQDDLVVEPAKPAAGTPVPGGAPESGAAARTYMVASGDTLWKIAERVYGNGADYQRIFEANRDVLDSPDHILPGQELVIPNL